jgi:hypothetical protein
MKTKLRILIVALALMHSLSGIARDHKKPVKIKFSDNCILFLRVQKSMVGATVEVFTTDGKLMSTETVTKRTIIIDFISYELGEYTIKISSPTYTETFIYDHK